LQVRRDYDEDDGEGEATTSDNEFIDDSPDSDPEEESDSETEEDSDGDYPTKPLMRSRANPFILSEASEYEAIGNLIRFLVTFPKLYVALIKS